jgi:glycine/D-amino acid oxidase-like deaminating enzyme
MRQPSVAIVGAGILGCLVARELAGRHPEVSITVLDRDAIGSGASRRSVGLHMPRGASARTRRMSADSHAYYADLKARRPGLPIYPVGATLISDRGSASGPGGDYLTQACPSPAGSPEDRVAAGPADRVMMIPDGCRAWRLAGCHYADVYQLGQAIAADLRPRVRFLEGVAVTGLVPRKDSVTVHTGTGERLVADSVILAPGPWLSAPAWAGQVTAFGLRVKKIVALHIEPRPHPADEAVIFDPQDAFLLPVIHRGHWLFSYTSQEWDVDPDAPALGLSAADLGAARDCLRRYSPALAQACGAGRVFCDAYSPNREPLVRALDETGRIVFAGAANGSGYRLGPAIAAEAADLLEPWPTEGVTGDHQYV